MKLTQNSLDRLIEDMLREYNSSLMEMPAPKVSPAVHEATNLDDTKEGGMLRQKLFHMAQQAQQLHDMLGDRENVEEWIQDKITTSSQDLRAVFDHLLYSRTKQR